MAGLGFASGLPFMLSALTLEQWLAEHGVRVQTIGLAALIGLSYTLKFLWAPLFDGLRPPLTHRLGRRRGWLLWVQPALALAIAWLALAHPEAGPRPVMARAALVAFLSACQDILIDAWRIERFDDATLGIATAVWVWGYRIALLVSGAGAIAAATHVGWHAALLGIAALAALSPLLTLAATEPETPPSPPAPWTTHLRRTVLDPIRALLLRPAAPTLLAFILAYRLGEAVAVRMAAPFYRSLGYSRDAVAAANAIPALAAVLAGTAAGGWLTARLGTARALFAAGIAATATMTLWLALAWSGPSLPLLLTKVTAQLFTEGMAQTAFIAFLSNLTDRRHTATQYALLSSLAATALHTLGGTSGYLEAALGWTGFYAACTAFCLVPLAILFTLRNRPELFSASVR
jgi:MFS transporter, PAT family, beta-lactamase induction signal transducer AmpG